MSSWVLDASALLALLNQEPGWEQVEEAVAAGAAISAVNLSEAAAKLCEAGMPEAEARDALDSLGLEIVDFDAGLAYAAAHLRPITRGLGLSLGDRACLALAQHLHLPVLTADRGWEGVQVGVEVRTLR